MHDIGALDLSALDLIGALESVSLVYNEGDGRIRYGFIAEDVQAINPHLVTYSASGTVSGIDDRAILSVIVHALKEIWQRVLALIDTDARHDTELASLYDRIAALESQLGSGAAPHPENVASPSAPAPIEIIINGNNPAELAVGDDYVDLGATASSSDAALVALGVRTFVANSEVDVVTIDTSASGARLIHYRVLDANGTILAEAVRTVVAESAAATVEEIIGVEIIEPQEENLDPATVASRRANG